MGLLAGRPDVLVNLATEDAAAVHTAIAAVTETLIGYARALLDAGASGIFFAPLTWASRDTCREDFYREFGRPYDLLLLDRDVQLLDLVARGDGVGKGRVPVPAGAVGRDTYALW